jgi:hypothetical protein
MVRKPVNAGTQTTPTNLFCIPNLRRRLGRHEFNALKPLFCTHNLTRVTPIIDNLYSDEEP